MGAIPTVELYYTLKHHLKDDYTVTLQSHGEDVKLNYIQYDRSYRADDNPDKYA
jgi:hypothetical protein